jgi:hypothetical protein
VGFASDNTGLAQISILQAGIYRLEVTPPLESSEGERFEFSRWLDEVFSPARDVSITSRTLATGKALQVGFAVSNLVSLKFIDLAGEPIDWGRVDSVTLASSLGQEETIDSPDERWLKASRVVRRVNGLQLTAIQYSVESALVDGSNVVHRAQQRFYPTETQQWPVQLLFYSARISARDAILGYPIGSGIELTYPDGRVETHQFGPSAELSLEALARGEYTLRVTGRGYSPPRPLSLTRNQVVELQVVSYLDLGVILSVIGVPALGVFMIGRPHLLRGLRRRAIFMRSRQDPSSDAQLPLATQVRRREATASAERRRPASPSPPDST